MVSAKFIKKLKESIGLKQVIRRYGMLIVFLIIAVSLAISSPTFRSPANIINVLQQNAVYAIIACGMLLMIIVGGFDL